MITAEPIGHTLLIRLDRPSKKNALTPAMLDGLISHLDTAWSAHAIVLSGTGDCFCAGFDLPLCQADDTALAALLTSLSAAVHAMRTIPCPVIIAAHGAAIAGGCALLSGADIVVTNSAATLGYPVLRLGISPAVAAPLLFLSVGTGPARARLMSGQLMIGSEALAAGLAHECCATREEVEPKALELAKILADKPRHAIAYTKNFLNRIDDSLNAAHAPLASQLNAAREASLSLVGSAEQRTLLAAFLAKSTARAEPKS